MSSALTSIPALLPYDGFDPTSLITCPDGRCMPTSSSCMTAFSCSSSYPIKAGSFGLFCLSEQLFADLALQILTPSLQNVCPKGMFMCLGGQCRSSVYDCPMEGTCPASVPVMCRDGQCVTSSEACLLADTAIDEALRTCLNDDKVLCNSDLTTCALSQNHCPTLSTCPFGYVKCSESVCIDPLTQSCPSEGVTCAGTESNDFLYCRDS